MTLNKVKFIDENEKEISEIISSMNFSRADNVELEDTLYEVLSARTKISDGVVLQIVQVKKIGKMFL